MKCVRLVQALVVALAALAPAADAQEPAGTAFVYQGRLEQAGVPGNGAVPMTFALWDASSGGNQVGPTLTFDGVGGNPPPVNVTAGIFVAALDFGVGAFGPQARWVEVAVDGVTLSPRQRVSPTPAALFSAAPWATVESGVSYTGGRVGVGTSSPSYPLDVHDPADSQIGIRSTSGGTPRHWTLQSSSGTASGQLAGSFQIVDRTAGASRLLVDSAGNVGIGTPQPSSRLTVEGGASFSGFVGIGTTTPQTLLHVAQGAMRMDTDRALQFGATTENTDPVYFIRQNFDANRTGFTVVIGDDPAGGAGFDEFRIVAGNLLRFQFTSDARAFKAGAPVWEVLSDARLKHDIEPLGGALDRVLQLKGRAFSYNDPGAMGARPGRCIGFVAQEVEPHFPEWVGTGPDGVKSMHIAGFEALAVEALRDLREEKDREVAALRAEKDRQIRDLTERLARLEALLPSRGASQAGK